jgi:hypothetical protein
MTELINALDEYTNVKRGENGHAEYDWSNSLQERIVQLSFQIVRNNGNNLEGILRNILFTLSNNVKSQMLSEREISLGYLSLLYKMIGHTRDIVDGKGEYELTYMMIRVWNEFYPELAKFALRCLVNLDDDNIHQYGSWKDIKYFCKHCLANRMCIDDPLIQHAISITNEQLRKDYENLHVHKNIGKISLAAKWIPREKSCQYRNIYESLATNYFKQYLNGNQTINQMEKALLKCKTEYRKLLSSLNRAIDTVQIKQCGHNWNNINFNKVTSVTLTKQKKAFLNIKKDNSVRFPDDEDRVKCSENFKNHIEQSVNGKVEMKGKRVGMADFTKQAIELNSMNNFDQTEKDLLNSQWRDNASQNGCLGKMIAMVDVSGSMEGDPMHVAIALGIRIAEKSMLGKRVMTFSSKPTWVNLEPYTDFISQVRAVKDAEWGMNTNFNAALDMILDAIVTNKMAPEDVQDMILVILSDMQMDEGDKCDKQILYESMKEKYADAGIRVNGVPYKPPHILFWNLRGTSGFPSLSNQPNASMMSGFSPTLLNLFCEEGLDALQSVTPWSILNKSLENERYKIMSNYIEHQFSI